MSILEVKSVSKSFGGVQANVDISVAVEQGSIVGLIGPNGSGKTTLFNLIAGNLKSSSGAVTFDEENITDVPSYELFSKGLLRTFQIAHEFSNLSVLENLMMAHFVQSVGLETEANQERPPTRRLLAVNQLLPQTVVDVSTHSVC